jgi:hypothetical protein
LMQLIQDSPDLLTNEQAPGIQDYVQSQLERQKAMRAEKEPFSTKVLAPSIVKNLTADQQVKFYRNVNSGMPVADAFDATMEQDRMEKLQMKAAENELMMQRLGASRSRTGTGSGTGGGGRDDLISSLTKVTELLRDAQEANPDGGATVDAYASIRDNLIKQLQTQQLGIDAPTSVKEQPAPGSAEAIEAARLAKEKADLEKKQQVPTLPPAPPATAEEEAAFKEQQKRGVTQEQRQQLADAAWTGVKGTAAARGADATGTPDVISEARKAIVGGETTNKRAQRIAALARAYADGRDVQMTEQVRQDFDPTGRIVNMPVRKSPAEALVRELGYEPDAIVGQAPSSPGGPLRDVTALEAANAILADTAVPFLELKKGVKVEQRQAELTPKVAKGLEKIQGQVNTPK